MWLDTRGLSNISLERIDLRGTRRKLFNLLLITVISDSINLKGMKFLLDG